MSIRELESGKIELWTSFLHEIVEDRLLDQYKDLLAPEERVQQVRFHFERDQHRYLVTRALVRVVLSKYCEIEPKDWVFNKGSHGKPVIGNDHASATGLFFNISHTNGIVIVGVASHHWVSRKPSSRVPKSKYCENSPISNSSEDSMSIGPSRNRTSRQSDWAYPFRSTNSVSLSQQHPPFN
jgi:hypothetical protein